MKTRTIVAGALVCAMAISSGAAEPPKPKPLADSAQASDWREEYAYTLGTQAYIFGYP